MATMTLRWTFEVHNSQEGFMLYVNCHILYTELQLLSGFGV